MYRGRKYSHSLGDNIERREANRKQTPLKKLAYRESVNNRKLTEYGVGVK